MARGFGCGPVQQAVYALLRERHTVAEVARALDVEPSNVYAIISQAPRHGYAIERPTTRPAYYQLRQVENWQDAGKEAYTPERTIPKTTTDLSIAGLMHWYALTREDSAHEQEGSTAA